MEKHRLSFLILYGLLGSQLLYFVFCDILAFLIRRFLFLPAYPSGARGVVCLQPFPHVFAQFLLMAGPGTKVQMQMIVFNSIVLHGIWKFLDVTRSTTPIVKRNK